MMSPSAAVSGWPAMPEEPVAYVQVSDYLGLLLRRTDTVGPTCPSCHTVNRGRALHCRACGESMPSTIDDQVENLLAHHASEKTDDPDASALGNVLRLALVPSLVLFAAFVAWYATRMESRVRFEPSAMALSTPAATVVPQSAQVTQGDRARLATFDSRTHNGETKIQPGRDEPQVKNDDEPVAQPSAASTFSPRKSRRPLRAAALNPDPLAACRSRNFLARAVCVNARCAEPRAARWSECREALRQRRIDEARRNPTLVG